MDYEFGRLMKVLDELGQGDNTFVMFTSDNGPETLNRYKTANRSYGSPGALRGMKLHLYEGGIRVPGIIRWPGHVRRGKESGEPVCGTDVLPTLCEIAGAVVPTDRAIDGASFLPLFAGHEIRRKRPLYWRYDKALSTPHTVAMRQDRWKLLANPELTQFELYDLRNDINEANNLAERRPKHLAEMKEMLAKLHAEIDAEGPDWPGIDAKRSPGRKS
jgi:arylsulfatase A